MLLAQLYDQLAPAFPPSIRKDLQTTVRVLAKRSNVLIPSIALLSTTTNHSPRFTV